MIVDQLRQAREESANVAYMDFIKHIKSDRDGLFCFFEGKDSPYYRPRILECFQGNNYPIRCSGKNQVLKVYSLIKNHKEYDNYKKVFFVDRDFDLPIGNIDIYETPCYSIENLYTNCLTFAEVLKNEFGLSEASQDFDNCIQQFVNLQKEYHESTALFNAWYSCVKRKRSCTGQDAGVTLQNSLPRTMVTISLGGISSDYDLEKIKAHYPNAIEVTQSEVEEKLLEFNSLNRGLVFRGKYEFDFLMKILNELIVDSKTNKAFISSPIKYCINPSQSISQFSQYAYTPPCLTDYIRQRVN